MKHLCCFLAYRNFEDIQLCYESCYKSTKRNKIDFFIVENHSDRSTEIREYFLQQDLVGYIYFIRNIAANSMRIWYRDYSNFIKKYDILTISDCDFFIHDSESMFEEIIQNLHLPGVIVSSAKLYDKNCYSKLNPIRSIEKYTEFMKNRKISNGPEFVHTAANFVTLTTENFFKLFTNFSKPILDTDIRNRVEQHNGKWSRTTNNLIYHLTWDRYQENNEYFEFKKDFCKIGQWRVVESCDYIKLGESHG